MAALDMLRTVQQHPVTLDIGALTTVMGGDPWASFQDLQYLERTGLITLRNPSRHVLHAFLLAAKEALMPSSRTTTAHIQTTFHQAAINFRLVHKLGSELAENFESYMRKVACQTSALQIHLTGKGRQYPNLVVSPASTASSILSVFRRH